MGSTITWTNTDVETHTITSGSPDSNTNKGNEFDSGNLNPKQNFEHTFSKLEHIVISASLIHQ